MIHQFLLFQKGANPLQLADFVGVMEHDAVGMNFEVRLAALAEFTGKLGFIHAIDFLHVEDEFIQFEGIVVDLAQLYLPDADVRSVV